MPTPEEEEASLLAAEQQSGPEGTTGPVDGATGPVESIPENFQDLERAAREMEPSLKNSDNLPSGPDGPPRRGPDGKFLNRNALASGAEGATGPAVTGATGVAASGATGAVASGPTGATGPVDIDAAIKADPQMRPSTRKVIDAFKTERDSARAERDRVQTELATAQAKITEIDGKLKTIKAPKEMEDELASLRQQVRQLDISKDPALVKKYDAKIKTNGESALGLLKDFGVFTVLDKDKKPVEMTEAEKKALSSEIEKTGFGIRGMARYISALEKAGEYEAAERLRQMASQNDQLARDKQEEVDTWNKDYEGLQAQRTRESEAAHTAYLSTVKAEGETSLQSELGELVKTFPHLNRPPAPLETDSTEVKAQKQKAIDEYTAAEQQLNESVKVFSSEGKTPEQQAKAYGKMSSAAVTSLILKQHVLPKLQKDLAEATARAVAAETDLAKLRKAGNLNRAHSAAITTPHNGTKVPAADLSLEEAARAIAAESGMKL